jgi:hypothetical protein
MERCTVVNDGRSDLYFPKEEYLINGFEDLNDEIRAIFRRDREGFAQHLLGFATQHRADFVAE